MLSSRAEQWLDERGISREVWEQRPYEDFIDADATRALYEPELLANNQLTDLRKMVNWMEGRMGKQENPDPGGIIIHRVRPPGFPKITPELKTWKALPGRKLGPHYHGPKTDEPLFYGENRLKDFQIWDPDSDKAIKHMEGKRHQGENAPDPREPHVHEQPQKYRFLASPVVDGYYKHSHKKMFEKLLENANQSFPNHLLKQHAFKLVPHIDEEHKHRYPFKDKNAGVASRIDLHRLALPLLESAERAYFGIEGCPKADSILSHILKHSRAESVFSVPSVAQWDPPRDELDLFAQQFLVGKQIVVVPDADWAENWQVERQALLLRQRLRRLGLDVHIAAPPIEEGAERDEDGKLKRNGIDDYLAAGHALENLIVIGREPSLYLPTWVAEQDGRIDGVLTDANVLEDMSVHADDDGKLNVSRTAIAGLHEKETSIISSIVSRLEARGAVKHTGGSLEVVEDFFSHRMRWKATPELELAVKLRPRKMPERRLAEIQPGEGGLILTDEAIRRASRERIIDAYLASVKYVHVTPEEWERMKADGTLDRMRADAPEPGTRKWQEMREDMILTVDENLDGNVRNDALAAMHEVGPSRVRKIRKRGRHRGERDEDSGSCEEKSA
jgi:hypothetical protein